MRPPTGLFGGVDGNTGGNGGQVVAQAQNQANPNGNDPYPPGLRAFIRLREGYDVNSYLDSEQLPTAGLGHLLVGDEIARYPIGTRVPQHILDAWEAHDLNRNIAAARRQIALLPAAANTNDFLIAMTSVNFQLGEYWNTEHRRTWAFMLAGQWENAAVEAADSSWATQTPTRLADFQRALRSLAAGGTGSPVPGAQGTVQGNGNTAPTASGTITGTEINVRQGPGTNYTAVRQLNTGDSVSVYETSNGWVRIAPGQWVKSDFVRQTAVTRPNTPTTPATQVQPPANNPVAPTTPTTQRPPTTVAPVTTNGGVTAASGVGSVIGTGTVIGNDVNVRSGPGLSHAALPGQLSNGASVSIYEVRDGWLRIGTNRWVFGQFVNYSGNRPTTPRPVTPTTPTAPVTPAPVQQAPTTGTGTASGTSRAAVSITRSVGADGANLEADVRKIQQLLKDLGFRISVTGTVGKNTIGAIAAFQIANGSNDGRVDPGGRTLELMNNTPGNAFYQTAATFREDENAPRLTGSRWTNPSKLTTDGSGESIPKPQYGNMRRLIQQMEVIGANIRGKLEVGSGYRSPYHNANTEGSASQSNHQFGRAVDIYSDFAPSELRAQLRTLIREGKIHNGGIGLYSWGCHYDIDSAREW